MARAKRIAKISNRDRTLYTLHDLGHKSFKREQFIMEARAHSERAGEAWGKRGDINIMNELDALLAEGVVVWDEDRKECRISDDAATEFAQHGLPNNKSVSFRDAYAAAARYWRAVFPPNKRKTRLEYMWDYIRSCGKIEKLVKQVAALLAEVAQNKVTIASLRCQLAAAQQVERERAAAVAATALPTPGPSTPAPHAADAYPTPRSEADEDSPPTRSRPLQQNAAPMTPVSNPRPAAALRRRALRAAGAPPSPSPLARQVSGYAAMDADEGKDDVDADADESMVVDKLEVSDLRDAEDSMMLDGASDEDDEDEDEEDEELPDVDVDEELEPVDVWSTRTSRGKGMFMRVSDMLGNVVGDLFAAGRRRSGKTHGPSTAEQEAQTLDAILPELTSRGVPERVDEAVDASVGPSTAEVAIGTDTPVYCERAVSPVPSGPDPREVEIAELRAQVEQLTADLDSVRGTLAQRDTRVEELERQLAGKQRRLQVLMGLHAQMTEEFAMERAGQ